jgi:glutathione peroxidase
MQRVAVILTVIAALAALSFPASADEKGATNVPAALNFTMKSLEGKDVNLSHYQGKVVLFVNVASECGYTPQYRGLQALHDKYAKDGLAIIGVPANDFGRQEPGSNDEIASFCQKNYGVKFDMLAKVPVAGKDQVPLYKYLTSRETDPKFAGAVKWNFTKFLVSRKGEVVGRFEPGVEPESKELTQAIEAELAKK